jgi:hypothetical protein
MFEPSGRRKIGQHACIHKLPRPNCRALNVPLGRHFCMHRAKGSSLDQEAQKVSKDQQPAVTLVKFPNRNCKVQAHFLDQDPYAIAQTPKCCAFALHGCYTCA